jgi:superfamily II DNA or RNA helicase/tRNA(Ser,Leu) C12 N-acetylase TAN1
MEHNNKNLSAIFQIYSGLKNSNKQEFDNRQLSKIFEYYSCIKLSEEHDRPFYEYNDIDPNFKELNKMSRNDTGIDCSDLINTIVQCKLRKHSLTWKECSTFFGSINIFNTELNKLIIRWNNLILTRNDDCKLSKNLSERKELFIDKPYNKNELIVFCENLLINPPTYPIINNDFKLRDYQLESINIIKENKNVIINLPTGTGKNSVIIYSLEENKKYLILVPRIILMDQLKDEIIKHKPKIKKNIQLIGNNNNTFNEHKLITICVFNSVHLIDYYCSTFEKIFIDEAHHINKPAIYYENEEYDNDYDDESIDIDNDDESIDTKDDSENELINVKKYTEIIKNLVEYNNNVYLSATIDKTDNFEYYSKDIRNMIELKYLCDYQIHVPIFNDDPTNKNICEHLLKNYRNIIIYCNSQKEGKLINKLMNKLQLNSSEYIDCNTSKKKRDIIIEKYKNGEISFLVNVRILVEGFDAPITKGVCFMHLPTNKTTLIQIIGRCLRLHETKTIANIILPFSSNDDEKNICNFLKVMAKNDSRIKKSFENKRLGGYISIENTNEEDTETENEDIEFKYNMIYNSLGILQNGEKIWIKRLDEVKLYIDTNNKRPSSKDKSKDIKQLGKWLSHQVTNYRNIKYIMLNEKIYNKWTEFINDKRYILYFQSNEEKWIKQLDELKHYIDLNNKRPSQYDKNSNIVQLQKWIGTQQTNYKNKKQIMLNEWIYNRWTEFINDKQYITYFQSNEEIWIKRLNEVKLYIDTNNKKPSDSDNDSNIKQLRNWIGAQQTNYKNKKYIMSNEEIYNKWTEFINDKRYISYFQSNEELWIKQLDDVKLYIDTNNKRPPGNDNDSDIKQLGKWIGTQQTNYKNKKQIMLNEWIYNRWTEFINDKRYISYFQSNEELWIKQLEEVKLYIDTNNKKPSEHDKNSDIKQLGSWISHQQTNYKNKNRIMSNEEIYNRWTEFVNDKRYISYFQSNEELWIKQLEQVKLYIDTNNKRPSGSDIDSNIKQLGNWISTQQQKYKNKKQIMLNEWIYNKWTEFINDKRYISYFQSNEESWIEMLDEVKNYINSYNKRPSKSYKDSNIKQLGTWISDQQMNYKNKKNIMSNEEIYNKWTDFINDKSYISYFQSNEELWIERLNEVKQYIDLNNKRPSTGDKNSDIKQLGNWISAQVHNYKNKKYIMSEEVIYNRWTEFINDKKYISYFQSNEESWIKQLDEVKQYIDLNNKRPSNHDKNSDIKQLAKWISHQVTNYKNRKQIMSEEGIYNKWTEFINDKRYISYFQSK